MASKGRGNSISLYSRGAVDVLSHPDITVLGAEPDTSDRESSHTTDPAAVHNSLIRLSSLEELMSFDGEEEGVPPSEDRACSLASLTLEQLSVQEIRRDMFCNTCQTVFASREEQVEHYGLDWHRYNLKRKLKGLTHVNQEEFERVSGDLSSISGSESDSAPSGKEDEPRPSHAHTELLQTPFVYFTTNDKNGQKLYAVYRSIVTQAKRGGAELEAIKNLKKERVWIILMRSGGHFAGAVFNGGSIVAHKTFHRYTVRAKRGTAQSVRDAQSGGHGPKSAGASIRRYNEAALAQEMQDLVASWSEHIKGATAIFIRTPKYSKEILVGGGKAPFSKDDPRLRAIPFATRRPTLSEVKRVHSQLACIYKVPLSALVSQGPTVKKSPLTKKKPTSAKVTVPAENLDDLDVSDEGALSSEVPAGNGMASNEKVKKKRRKKAPQPREVIPDTVRDLLSLCRDPEDNVELLLQRLRSMNVLPLNQHTTGSQDQDAESHDKATKSPDRPIVSHDESHDADTKSRDLDTGSHDKDTNTGDVETKPENSPISTTSEGSHLNQSDTSPLSMLNALWGGSSLLHVAARTGNVSIVSALLHYGADPTIRDQSGKTPYLVSKDKPVRDSFRRFMASHPTAYDYDSTHIPSPLTEEMERERKEKANEKKKAQKKARKQREKEMKSVRETEKISNSREQKVAELSDREKRAMAAERRLASQLPSSTAVTRAGRCSQCEQSLVGVVPFERLSYKYCSMNCLKQHRDQLGKQS